MNVIASIRLNEQAVGCLLAAVCVLLLLLFIIECIKER